MSGADRVGEAGATGDRVRELVANELTLDSRSVWIAPGTSRFQYSDGPAVERYLEKVLARAKDLSSSSGELQQWVRDWPTEYHLSPKRAQLLRDFAFRGAASVLEVGCGCGGLTRFLGETFDEVVAVDGSCARARLARLRTRDQPNVAIVCAPFQDLRFRDQFDVVFCIGVLEYAGLFVDAPDPHDAFLHLLARVVRPGGALVLAIENQFGLKYLATSREDHTGIMFDGWEGYPRDSRRARTFGYDELKARLTKYFGRIDFHFPYPDYKMPTCVLSERFFARARLAELVGSIPSRDYSGPRRQLFDERFTLLALERNGKLPFFANSFLVVASAGPEPAARLHSLGVRYSTDRVAPLQVVTRFVERDDGTVWVEKSPLSGHALVEHGRLVLHADESRWIDGLSLHGQVLTRVKQSHLSVEEVLAPCGVWAAKLRSFAVVKDGRLVIDGKHVDSIWRNAYIVDGECVLVDREWQWRGQIGLNVVVIRSIVEFLQDVARLRDVHPALRSGPRRSLIVRIAKVLRVELTSVDFAAYRSLEAELSALIFGVGRRRRHMELLLVLNHPGLSLTARTARVVVTALARWFLSVRRRITGALRP